MEWHVIEGNPVQHGNCTYTQAANVPGGVLIRTIIQKLNANHDYALSQSVVFVPDAFVSEDTHELMSR